MLASFMAKSAEHATYFRVTRTKIFVRGIAFPPAPVLMRFRPDAEEIGIAFLDRDSRDHGQDSRQREQPREAHLCVSFSAGADAVTVLERLGSR
jgi:hypothetical protein